MAENLLFSLKILNRCYFEGWHNTSSINYLNFICMKNVIIHKRRCALPKLVSVFFRFSNKQYEHYYRSYRVVYKLRETIWLFYVFLNISQIKERKLGLNSLFLQRKKITLLN